VGTNVLLGHDLERLSSEVCAILGGHKKQGATPPLWDGHAAERIANIISAG
jgi:UDP-N-acetylglucosamine 2-epimerase (non-hydrolysing)